MSIESLKSKPDLSLNEINLLLDNEKDVKTYKKLQYFKFKKMGFTKIESCELAGVKESNRYYCFFIRYNHSFTSNDYCSYIC